MAEIMNVVKEYIYPELLVLIPVLYFIGWCFKRSEKVCDKYIPAFLGVCGVLLCAIYMLSVTDALTIQTAFSTVFASVVQGLLCTAAAVFADQLKKQANKEA